MTQSLTNQTRKVLALANEAARSFNHEYVGTEHVLLGLIEDRSAGVADILATFGIDADKVYAEIERLVQRGAEPVALRTLPLTPRAARAVDHARFETRLMGEMCVRPEHLFLGLMNDRAGVACQVLINLGISLPELTKEVFKVFLAQMKVVERIVRPVKASTPRKRKIREELLAHLSAIYDQELDRLHDPTAALQAAAARLGDSAELANELQKALPFHERFSHFVESWFAWRAPESAARYARAPGGSRVWHPWRRAAVVICRCCFAIWLVRRRVDILPGAGVDPADHAAGSVCHHVGLDQDARFAVGRVSAAANRWFAR